MSELLGPHLVRRAERVRVRVAWRVAGTGGARTSRWLGKPEQARPVFKRMLSLNPNDNQGVRFCWHDLRRGLPWATG